MGVFSLMTPFSLKKQKMKNDLHINGHSWGKGTIFSTKGGGWVGPDPLWKIPLLSSFFKTAPNKET